MKRISIVVGLMVLVSVVGNAQNRSKRNQANAEMKFVSESHDYGSMEYNGDGSHTFKFTNNSSKPLVVTNVKSSCGCTTPTWPQEPIQPGQSGSINVVYNTKLTGAFNKTIQVFSSAKNSPIRLTVRGRVAPHPQQTKSQAKAQAGADQNVSIQQKRINDKMIGAEIEEGGMKQKQGRQVDYKKKIEEARKKIKK